MPAAFGSRPATSTAEAAGCFIKDTGASDNEDNKKEIARPGYKKLLAQKSSARRIIEASVRGLAIPQVTIKTGLTTPDGCEELLTEYLCDHLGCPNIATQTLGCVREVGVVAAVCDEHAPKPKS